MSATTSGLEPVGGSVNNKLFIIWILITTIAVIGCQAAPTSGPRTEAVSSAASAEINHPWAGCAKGSYVHYKIMRPADGAIIEQKQTLVDILPDAVLLETATLVNNEWRSEGVLELPPPALAKPSGEMKYTEQTLKIADREIRCKVVERVIQIGEASTIARHWMSRDVPGGMARKEMGGAVIWEVVDFLKK